MTTRGLVSAQDTIALPRHGSGGIITFCSGYITDDGRENDYTDTTNGYITIAPSWATTVSLYFEQFDFEQVFDYVRIYDGPGTGFPLIGEYSGNELLGVTISSTGPYITVQQITDDIVHYSGFKAVVSCLLGEENEEYDVFSVFPVPATDYLYTNNKTGGYSGYITDTRGKTVMFFSGFPVNVSLLSEGLYFIHILDQNGKPKLTRKFLKA